MEVTAMSQNEIPAKIKTEIEELKKIITDQDIYIYYGSTVKGLSAKSEMNKEDAFFIEHETKHYSPGNNKALLILHTNGGFLETAITLVDHLKKFYKDSVSVVVCERAMSAGTFLALSLNRFYMSSKAQCSDFSPVEGIKNGDPNELTLFVAQFSETVFQYIGNGLLAYRSSNDSWAAINQISPFFFKPTDHTALNFREITETIDEILPFEALNGAEKTIEKLHETILEEMRAESLSKILVINGSALVD